MEGVRPLPRLRPQGRHLPVSSTLRSGFWAWLGHHRDLVEAQALSLVVAVESVLDRFFHEIGKSADGYLTKIDMLIEHVKAWDKDAKVLERAVGAVGQLKHIRAGDRFLSLIASGAVCPDAVAAWKKMRNSVAHGDWSGTTNLQVFLDRIGEGADAFLPTDPSSGNIYTGLQTDYGTHGFPFNFLSSNSATQENC